MKYDHYTAMRLDCSWSIFDHAGVKEAVLHGETGLLAPEPGLDMPSEYLMRMLRDYRFWEKCGERGRAWGA